MTTSAPESSSHAGSGGASSSPLLAPEQVIGRYTVLELLGVGERFEVYRARLAGVLGFEKEVALKLPTANLRGDARALSQLVRRMKGVTALSHAALLQVVDLGQLPGAEGEGCPYFVTELARGTNLRAILDGASEAGRRVPTGAVSAVLAQIAQVFDYVRRREPGLCPLALRLEDVFVSPQGDLKIKDFCLREGVHDGPLLGALARDLCGIVQGAPPPALDALIASLLSGASVDEGELYEQLLEIAFAASSDPAQRDIALLAQVAVPVVPKPFAVDELSISGASLAVLAVPRAHAELFTAHRWRPLDSADEAVALFGESLSDGDERPLSELIRRLQRESATLPAYLDLIEPGEPAKVARGTAEVSRRARAVFGHPRVERNLAVSAEAAALLRGSFVFEASGGEHRFVLGEARQSASAAKFVGRSDELDAVARAIFAVTTSGAQLLSVHGPAGIGKTRLCRELLRRIPEDRVGFVFVTCNRDQECVPLGSLAAVLRALLSLPAASTIDPALLSTTLRGLGLGPAQVAGIGRILGVSLRSDERPPSTHDALIDLFAVMRLGRPLVVILDDAHDLDPTSLSVLVALVASERARTLPALFMLVDRGAPTPNTPTLAVSELSDDEASLLIASRLGARLLPPELFELVVQRVGGHPALIDELLRELSDLALVEVKGGVAALLGEPPAGLLESKTALLRARIERLSPIARTVLATLSFLPEGVQPAALAALAGLSRDATDAGIEELLRAAIVRTDEAGRCFCGTLFGEIARLSAPFEAAPMQGRLALHFEEQGESRRAAQHYELAGRSGDAARMWQLASADLERDGADAAALDAARRGLGAALDGASALALLERIVRLLPRASQVVFDADAALADALALADGVLTPERRAELRVDLALALAQGGASAAAETLIAQVDPATSPRGDAARLAIAVAAQDPRIGVDAVAPLFDRADAEEPVLLDAAEVSLLAGDLGTAQRLLDRAATAGASASAQPRLFALRAWLALSGGDRSRAVALFDELQPALREEDRQPFAARALLFGARLGRASGRPGSRAFALLSEAQRAARRTGQPGIAEQATAELELAERGLEAAPSLEARLRRAHAEGRHNDAAWIGLSLARLVPDRRDEVLARARDAGQLGAALVAAQLA